MCCFQGPPTFPKLDFGLWARVFSAVFTHLPTRFLNHVTSGSHEPAILFSHWSAVSPTGNDMTSSSGHVIALDQSGASIRSHTSPPYYSQPNTLTRHIGDSCFLFVRNALYIKFVSANIENEFLKCKQCSNTCYWFYKDTWWTVHNGEIENSSMKMNFHLIELL